MRLAGPVLVKKLSSSLTVAFSLWFSATIAAGQEAPSILLQSTTSTQNSGLYDHILPLFTAETGIKVNVVAVGTGQALKNARNCDADLLLVHAKEAEEAFVASGYGEERFDVMENDFVIIGPKNDPAKIKGASSLNQALAHLENANNPFISRGDDSGTHKKERSLWRAAQIEPNPREDWYREVGAGMGAALNIAVGLKGYTLSDRATWITFANKTEHTILFEGDPALKNQYGVIAVSTDHCANVDAENSRAFITWILSEQGQNAIDSYRVQGARLFFANAK